MALVKIVTHLKRLKIGRHECTGYECDRFWNWKDLTLNLSNKMNSI